MALSFSERHRLVRRRRRQNLRRRFLRTCGWLVAILLLSALVSVEAGLVLR